MRPALRVWRYLYGENPLHLLAMVGCFALVGYVVSFVYADPSVVALAIWFVGAVIGHDLVLYPLYALADQPLVIARWARRRVLPRRPPLVPAVNHVRAPVLGSLVLGLIYFPTISLRGDPAFTFASGHSMVGEYANWLLITGVLFLGSAVVYAARLGTAARREVVRRRRGPALIGAAGDGAPPTDNAPVETRPEEPTSGGTTLDETAPDEPGSPEREPASGEPAEPEAAEPEPTEPEPTEPEDHGRARENEPEPSPAAREPETDPRSP